MNTIREKINILKNEIKELNTLISKKMDELKLVEKEGECLQKEQDKNMWIDLQKNKKIEQLLKLISQRISSATVVIGKKWFSLKIGQRGMMAEHIALRVDQDGNVFSSSGKTALYNIFTVSYDDILRRIK